MEIVGFVDEPPHAGKNDLIDRSISSPLMNVFFQRRRQKSSVRWFVLFPQMGQFMVELLRSPKCSHSLAIMFGTGCINYRSSISSRIWDITLSRRIEDLLEGFSDFRPAVGAESSSA
jgi:hypothetical protein